MSKKLQLIQIELGSGLLVNLEDAANYAKVIAIYNAPSSVLRSYRTDPSVLDSFLREAEEMDAEAAMEIVSDFFGQWSRYQGTILSCAALNAKEMADRVRATQPTVTPKVTSEATELTEEIPE